MKEQPIYTTIIHQIRTNLKISLVEYCVADIITKLMGNPESKCPGWFYGAQDYITGCLGISGSTIKRVYSRLLERKFLEKDPETGFVRTTKEWYNSAYLHVGQNDPTQVKMTQSKGQNDRKVRVKMTPYNNSIYNYNNRGARPQEKKNEKNYKNTTPAEQAREFFNDGAFQKHVLDWLIKKGVNSDLAKEELENFVSYWTELNKSGTSQRWELQSAFELKRRLTTWFKNSKKWSTKKKTNTVIV